MNVSIGEHLTLLLYSLIVGAALGALYDAVRLIRTFLGLGINYSTSPLISRITPPIIGKRKKRERKQAGRAAACALVFVFDIVYMLAATAVTVIFIYHASSGVPRGFALAGGAVGFIIYMKTAGKLTAAAASYIFFFIETAIRYAVFFTVTPTVYIGKKCAALVSKLYASTVGRAISSTKRKRASVRMDRYIKKDLKNMLGEMADAIIRDGTENNNV